MTIVEKAIQKNELDLLFQGRGEYFIEDRDYPNEPTNYSVLWEKYIQEYLDANSGIMPNLHVKINESLSSLIGHTNDPNLGLYSFFSNLVAYYFAKKQGALKSIELNFPNDICDIVQKNKQSLISDHRWSGAEWNPANKGEGIWGVLRVCSVSVRNNGGPDYTQCFN